ncbi:aminotransferase class I/II-fold pyridoxal phosphate-dependent enzyme [Candidatus Fermentibacteria bacterium]|nr:aminotransferase class I/II-fold pyridoxal phosphate-dependent enzyme [Candidatus Fermentibacteria bacterium]
MERKKPFITASERVGKLPPYLFAELDRRRSAARKKGVDLIDFGIGDPDLPTPKPVVETARGAVAVPEYHRYPQSRGSDFFKEAAFRWLSREFEIPSLDSLEVGALIGAKEGLAHLPSVFCNPGDVVLTPNPGYPVYRASAILADATPVDVSLTRENGFLPDLGVLDESVLRSAKVVFLNYPNNPTGAVMGRQAMREIVEFVRRKDVLLVSDNSYSHIRFDGEKPTSFLEVPGAEDVCLELHSFSKTFNMTGWRVGFIVGGAKLVRTFMGVKENLDSGVFTAVQKAAETAIDLGPEHLDSLLATYRSRRDTLLEGLLKLGWDVCDTPGTFYLWAALPRGTSSMHFASRLISTAGIVVTPGNGFGSNGESYVRFALTVPEDRILKALGRLEQKEISSMWKKSSHRKRS